MTRRPFRTAFAACLLVAPISCTVLPANQLSAPIPVQMAATDFYENNGRWPKTKDELASALAHQRKPPDIRRWRVRFNERPDGSLDIVWADTTGPSVDGGEVNVQKPTSRPAATGR